MKKTIAVLFFLLTVATASFAQLFEYAKNEVRIFGGDGAALTQFFSSIDGGKEYSPCSGLFGADYTYNVFDRVAFGGGFAFSMINRKPVDGGGIDKKHQYLNFEVFALMKVIYFRTDLLKFYGAVSLGAGLSFVSAGGFGAMMPVVQVSPFGTRIGTDVAAFFVELGYGTTGIVNAGLVINIY